MREDLLKLDSKNTQITILMNNLDSKVMWDDFNKNYVSKITGKVAKLSELTLNP